jgi:glycosyltransferase involved in cell wall biosynthesis
MNKILLCLPDLTGGGAERVFVNLANSFKKRGEHVELLVGQKQGVYFDILDPSIPVHNLNASGLLNYLKAMKSFFDKQPSYTHILSTGDYISGALALLKLRNAFQGSLVPVLQYDIKPFLKTLPLPNRIWLRSLYRFVICKMPLLIAASKGIADNLIKVTGVKKNIQVIYNPVVDNSMIEKGNEDVPESVFYSNHQIIISIGRLTEQKDQGTLIKAFHLVKQKHQNTRLVILGIGDKESELKQLIADLNLDEDVMLMGFKTNPYAYLSKSSLFVLSSIYEGFGNVIAEALAMGVNVVSTDCPSGPAEILDYGRYGWLSPVGDVNGLAYNIMQALEHPKPKDELQQYANRYHLDIIAEQYLQVINAGKLEARTLETLNQ